MLDTRHWNMRTSSAKYTRHSKLSSWNSLWASSYFSYPALQSISINFLLGLLNSSLYNYFAKGIINNTNSIQLTGIHALPYIQPDQSFQSEIEFQVEKILERKLIDSDYDYSEEQQVIDNLVFNFFARNFDLTSESRKKIKKYYSINS